MRYLGSKRTIAKQILQPMLRARVLRPWVEPFVGSASVITGVSGGRRIGADKNKYLIALLKAVRDGWVPPTTITEEKYSTIKHNRDQYPDHLVGFVGFGCAFGGMFFGSYAKCSMGRNYAKVASNSLVKIRHLLTGVELSCCDYQDLEIPPSSLIYCDPPYNGTTTYADGIDHDKFWEWCRARSSEGNIVFVSEYKAPDDFMCVWVREHEMRVMPRDNSQRRVEKLFVYRGD